jgi:hypothetical protein
MITALPTPPSRADSTTFSSRADAFLGALPTFATEANALAEQVNEDSVIAANAAAVATGIISNYQGVYSAVVTYSVGQTVLYSGSYWISNVNSNLGNTPVEGANWSNVYANKSYSNITLVDGYTEETYAVSTSGSTALNLTNGSIQVFTLTGNITFTDSLSTGQSLLLGITPGANTVTWPTTTWSKVGGSGTAPTLTSSGVNWIVLWKIGSTLRGAFLGTA